MAKINNNNDNNVFLTLHMCILLSGTGSHHFGCGGGVDTVLVEGGRI
jgi:hypothetical protein